MILSIDNKQLHLIQGDHSPGKARECQSGQGEVRENGKVREKSGEVKSGVFSSSKYSKTRFSAGLHPGPHWGSLRHSPRPSSRLGRGTRHPLPQLLQPQLLNNWLSGLTLFFIIMTQTTVDHIGKHSIPGNLCLPLLEKSGNFMWSGKWSPC